MLTKNTVKGEMIMLYNWGDYFDLKEQLEPTKKRGYEEDPSVVIEYDDDVTDLTQLYKEYSE